MTLDPQQPRFYPGQRVVCVEPYITGLGEVDSGQEGVIYSAEPDEDGDVMVRWGHVDYSGPDDWNYAPERYLDTINYRLPDLTDLQAVDAWLKE